MTSTLDASTPREVWLEYERMKEVVEKRYLRHRAEFDRMRDQALHQVEHQLGCGIHPDDLTPEQRAEWCRCIDKWKGRECER